MRRFAAIFACCILVGCHPEEKATDKAPDHADKIVGIWEYVEGDDALPKGSTYEFMKDGSLSVRINLNGQQIPLRGSYKLDGDKMTMIITSPRGTDDAKDYYIKELTKDKFAFAVDPRAKATGVFKRVK